MNSNAIVTLADANYFELLEELINSIKAHEESKNVSICVLDAGLTNEQLELTENKVKLVKPSWWENKWLYFGYGATLSYAVFALIDQIGDSIKIF